MTVRKDGGPAFPHYVEGHPGMSLRDWFAGQIAAAITARDDYQQPISIETMPAMGEWIASFSYIIADAMLEERDK